MDWFTVDKQGLAKLLARKGKAFLLYELIQNALDENTKRVRVYLDRIDEGGQQVLPAGYARLLVTDDNPNGFADLSHAFTLFAESPKKKDATKRGRFNLGEKLVLAMCERAEIRTTTGAVVFDRDGRHRSRKTTNIGSMFVGIMKMTKADIEDCTVAVRRLIPPPGVEIYYNDEELAHRERVALLITTLPTEIADAEGQLRRTQRQTTVVIYEPLPGETAMIYEMGIPIVETGDRYHVNIMQKVPLTIDRENVPPAYLARVRASVVERMCENLTTEDANATWARDAMEHHGNEMERKTVDRLLTLRFGEKRVAFDLSDPEANSLAIAQGFQVVHGGNLSSAEWAAAKRTGSILPAGQVTPSPKPFSPDGSPLNVMAEADYPPSILPALDYIQRAAEHLLGKPIRIMLAQKNPGWHVVAAFGQEGILYLNYSRLGERWFSRPLTIINRLLIHELAHHYASNHLSEEYHDALCDLGARLTDLALTSPAFFVRSLPIIELEETVNVGPT